MGASPLQLTVLSAVICGWWAHRINASARYSMPCNLAVVATALATGRQLRIACAHCRAPAPAPKLGGGTQMQSATVSCHDSRDKATHSANAQPRELCSVFCTSTMMSPPTQQQPMYEFVAELGRGSFGSVVLARTISTGERVAIKRLARDARMLQQRYVESELLNHSQLKHPHVVQFKEVFLSPRHINIVMEYACGGSLFEYVQQRHRLKEPLARWFFQQLIIAIDYCHRKGVANRDIKLENMLLHAVPGQRTLLKVCDFGYSKHDNRSMACSKVGTLTYMAPEVLTTHRSHYDGKAADIWSCGVVLYTMLVGRYPFRAPTTPADEGVGRELMLMLEKMKSQDYPLPDSLGLSDGCKSLLRRMLHPDHTQRITLAGILADPWFVVGLPADALSINDAHVATKRVCRQSEAEIRAIVAAAVREQPCAFDDAQL